MSRWIDADKCITVQFYDDMYEEWSVENMTIAECLDRYTEEGCPSTEPKQQKGKWLNECENGHGFWVGVCDQCGKENHVNNFCPYCGAYMRSEEND